jgi:predicted metal-binding membrane protein
MERQPPVAAPSADAFVTGRESERGLLDGQIMLAGALLTLAAIAWVATDLRMAGMDAGPGTDPGAFGFYISSWVVMMGAMMLPSITPAVLAHSNDFQRQHRRKGRTAYAGNTGLFIAGYLAVWAAAGLLGYALLKAGRSLDGGLFAWDRAGRWVSAGVLIVAALYQLTPSKDACLTRCRSRSLSALKDARGTRIDALHFGITHGAWCLGCCWALMAALFALGAMSVGWMVLIAALIAAERLLPWRALTTVGVASVSLAVAVGVAVAPARVPMLTIPHSAGTMRAMGMPPRHVPMAQPTRTKLPYAVEGSDEASKRRT